MQCSHQLVRSNKFFVAAVFVMALVVSLALFGTSPETASARSLTSSQRAKLAAAVSGLEKNDLVKRDTRTWKKMKITGAVRAAMAAEYLCDYKGTWTFSKAKLKKTSKSLFGSDKVTIGGCIIKDQRTGKYTVGGWGNVCCKVTKKLKSLGKGYYRAKVVFGSDGMFPGADTTWTYYHVKLKKSSTAAMGYRIVGINAKNDRN